MATVLLKPHSSCVTNASTMGYKSETVRKPTHTHPTLPCTPLHYISSDTYKHTAEQRQYVQCAHEAQCKLATINFSTWYTYVTTHYSYIHAVITSSHSVYALNHPTLLLLMVFIFRPCLHCLILHSLNK